MILERGLMEDNEKHWYSVHDEGIASEINGMFFETWLKYQGFKKIRPHSNRNYVFISIETKEYSLGVHYPVPVFGTVNEGRCLTAQEFKSVYDSVQAGKEPTLPEEALHRKEPPEPVPRTCRETPLYTYEEFKGNVIRCLKEDFYHGERDEQVDQYTATEEFESSMKDSYNSAVKHFMAGEITELQFREGTVRRVSYCQYMLS